MLVNELSVNDDVLIRVVASAGGQLGSLASEGYSVFINSREVQLEFVHDIYLLLFVSVFISFCDYSITPDVLFVNSFFLIF